MRLLVVEDEIDLQEALCHGLRRCGYAVDATDDGLDAAVLCEVNDYDLVILDLNLPGLDGMEVLRRIRALDKPVRVLILSARSGVDDKIDGLDAGAGDYLTKPFHFRELEARVRTLLRRTFVQTEAALTCGGLRLDTNARTVSVSERPLELSMREFSILEYLLRNQGRPVSAEELLEHVWDGEADPFSNQIKVYISTIRRKLAARTGQVVIKNIRGAGYRIEEEQPC